MTHIFLLDIYFTQIYNGKSVNVSLHFIVFSRRHQENMSVQCIPPQTPLLCSKTGVCNGIPIFLNFAPKHRLWVLVRTATVYPQSMF